MLVKFNTIFAPNCYSFNNGQYTPLVDPTAIKRGYYVAISGSIAPNGDAAKPGLFIGMDLIVLVGYGEELVTTIDPSAAFAGGFALPSGASTTPVMPAAGMPQSPPPVPQPQQPPPMPQQPQQPQPQQPQQPPDAATATAARCRNRRQPPMPQMQQQPPMPQPQQPQEWPAQDSIPAMQQGRQHPPMPQEPVTPHHEILKP